MNDRGEQQLLADRAHLSAACVRPAGEADLVAVQNIYASHVLGGTGTFEEHPPDVHEIRARWRSIVARGLPYLVASLGDDVLGFAYAGQFRPRSAYRFTVENSIYVAPDVIGAGLGGMLLSALIERCRGGGVRQMIAVIGDSANTRSIRLHRRYGFCHAGTLVRVGFKFERWLDAVFMQRPLRDDGGAGAHADVGEHG